MRLAYLCIVAYRIFNTPQNVSKLCPGIIKGIGFCRIKPRLISGKFIVQALVIIFIAAPELVDRIFRNPFKRTKEVAA